MDIKQGDMLEMKKPHPCGKKNNKQFYVLKAGIDFKSRCMGCLHEIIIPRVKAEKNIRKIIREDNNIV